MAVKAGFQGTREQWLASLVGAKGDTGATGLQGLKGEQGLQGVKGDRGEQGIQGVQGLKGYTGEQGVPGVNGVDGKSPVMACVIRTGTPNKTYVAWKYETEPDAAYRDLYLLPNWATCNNLVTL